MIGFNYVKKILTFKPHAILSFFFQVELLLSGYFWKIHTANYVNCKKRKKENKRAGHLILGFSKCKVICGHSSYL